MQRKGQWILISVFSLFIAGFALAHLLLPDSELSYSERRRLAQLPEFSAKALVSGSYSTDFEEYMSDQFPLREGFRSIAALTAKDIFLQRDVNGYFTANGGIFKLESELKPEQVALAVNKINAQIAAHPEAGAIYYSVVPDKCYFTADSLGYPTMDYDELLRTISGSISTGEYIDLFDVLSIDDYYRTDTHWRQERLLPAAQALCKAMGAPLPKQDDYVPLLIGEFQGVLAAQSALPADSDELYIMESEATKSSTVLSAELEGALPVYAPDKFSGMEPYDVYLHGAQAVLTIENPAADTERELVIFRDSYGSSLSPLLISSYSKVTLVDLRYIMGELVSDYVDFDGADVLFIYSTTLLNSGGILR